MPCMGMVIGGLRTKVFNNTIYNVFGSTRTGKEGAALGIDFVSYYYTAQSANSDAQNCEVYGNYISTTKDPGLYINASCTGACPVSGNKFINNTLVNTGYATTATTPTPYSIWVDNDANITTTLISGNTIVPPAARTAATDEIYYRGTGYTVVAWPAAVSGGDLPIGGQKVMRRR